MSKGKGRKLQAEQCKTVLLHAIDDWKYITFCMAYIAVTILSFVNTLVVNHESSMISMVAIVALLPLIAPVLMLSLRKRRASKTARALATYAKVMYIISWIFVVLLVLAVVLLMIMALTNYQRFTEALNRDKTVSSLIGSLFSILSAPVMLKYYQYMRAVFRDTAAVLDDQPLESSCFSCAAFWTMLYAVVHVVMEAGLAVFGLRSFQWGSFVPSVLYLLPWLLLRETAQNLDQTIFADQSSLQEVTS